jgi:hypothetical protein
MNKYQRLINKQTKFLLNEFNENCSQYRKQRIETRQLIKQNIQVGCYGCKDKKICANFDKRFICSR